MASYHENSNTNISENSYPVDASRRISSFVNPQKRSALSTLFCSANIQPGVGFKAKTNDVFQDPLPHKQHVALPQPDTSYPVHKVQTFTILNEECEEKENLECQQKKQVKSSFISSLPENVTRLYSHEDQVNSVSYAKWSPSANDCSMRDSPMILDDSLEEPSKIVCQNNSQFEHAEYSEDLYLYLRESEVKHKIREYIARQPEISSSMRSILIDWLVEVSEEYKLQNETLFIAVSLIDRFLSRMSVVRNKLQLLGTASMFIATKYEEIYPPEIQEFVYITDDTYTKHQVLKMEQLLLKVLNFDLNVPTSYYFLHHLSTLCKLPEIVKHLAQYLCELSLLDAEPFLMFLPSIISGAAIWLANYTFGLEPWSPELERITKYKLQDFETCIKCLHSSFSNASKHPQQAVREKYKSLRFGEAALITPPQLVM